MKGRSTILTGAIVSAIVLGGGAMAIVIVADTTGTLGLRSRDFWWLALILGFFSGALVGGIEGFIVRAFRISILWTVVFGLGLGLIYLMTFAAGDSDITYGAALDINHQMFIRLFVIWQAVYPIAFSLFSTPSKLPN